ncbi:MAG: ADOP family duplicated permease [Vicinamibacterales bacterium]
MRSFFHDLGHAVRLSRRRPALTLVTVLTLAIAVGGNTAVFSVLNGLVLRPLPAADPGRLVRIFGTEDGGNFDVLSYANLQDVAERSRTLSSVAIHQQTFAATGLADQSESTAVELVNGRYFETFGLPPSRGRAVEPGDDLPGAPARVAVVSDRWWRTRLGGQPGAIGEPLYLNGTAFTVIGVMPPAFHGSYDALGTDVWVPLMAYDIIRPRGLPITRRGWAWLGATGRLAPGATVEQARAELDAIATTLAADIGDPAFGLRVEPASALPESMLPTTRAVLVFALVVVGLALGAASANVANAQLAGVIARQREIAVQLAMGASRARIARQWLTESLLVAAVAGAAGLLLAVWVRDLALTVTPPAGLANFGPTLPLDWRLLAFTGAVASVATLLFGGLPAWRASRVDIATPLKTDGPTATGSRRGGWARGALVATQVAVSLALLVSAGLLVRILRAQAALDVGFDTERLMVGAVDGAGLGLEPDRWRAYYRDTLARLRALPGVSGATAAVIVPLDGNSESRGVRIDGYTPPDGRTSTSVAANLVAPGYFEVLGVPLRAGRTFDDRDAGGQAAPVAVVSEAMARRFWSGDPVGRRIDLGAGVPPVTVVGVVGDTVVGSLGETPRPVLYMPLGAMVSANLSFLVRTTRSGEGLAPAVRRELRAADPRIRVLFAMTYAELRQAPLFAGRVLAAVSTAFGALALALALVGLYGVVTYSVTERRREFAVRLALGAGTGDIVRGVLTRSLGAAGLGVVAGLAAAAGLARLLGGFLVGIPALDPWTYGALAALVLTGSAVAAYVPARRAARVDPAAALGGRAS